MILTLKGSAFIAGMTAALLLGSTVGGHAARPTEQGGYTSVTGGVYAPEDIGYEALLRNQLTSMLDAPAPSPAMPEVGNEALPPPVPQKLLVFFEAGKTDLCPDAKLIVRQAAAEAQRKPNGVAVIQVTDASGLLNGNFQLAKERAKVVKDELVNLGVPKDQIAVSAKEAPESHGKVEIVYE